MAAYISMEAWTELVLHKWHKVEPVYYGDLLPTDRPSSHTIECITCGEVIAEVEQEEED